MTWAAEVVRPLCVWAVQFLQLFHNRLPKSDKAKPTTPICSLLSWNIHWEYRQLWVNVTQWCILWGFNTLTYNCRTLYGNNNRLQQYYDFVSWVYVMRILMAPIGILAHLSVSASDGWPWLRWCLALPDFVIRYNLYILYRVQALESVGSDEDDVTRSYKQNSCTLWYRVILYCCMGRQH